MLDLNKSAGVLRLLGRTGSGAVSARPRVDSGSIPDAILARDFPYLTPEQRQRAMELIEGIEHQGQ